MSGGRLFQSRLPAAVKAQSPTVTSLVVGMMMSSHDDDRRSKIMQTRAEWHADCDDTVKSKPEVEFQHGGRVGKFSVTSSQSHVPHCWVEEVHLLYWKSFFVVFYFLLPATPKQTWQAQQTSPHALLSGPVNLALCPTVRHSNIALCFSVRYSKPRPTSNC